MSDEEEEPEEEESLELGNWLHLRSSYLVSGVGYDGLGGEGFIVGVSLWREKRY